MSSTAARVSLLSCAFFAARSHDTLLPEHLRHGEVAKRIFQQEFPPGGPWAAEKETRLQPRYLNVPLDHEAPGSGSWELKYFLNAAHFVAGGPLVVSMPGEGPTSSCRPSDVVKALSALLVCPEHRFFGASVPQNDSSVANLRYLTVEQNLADVAALVRYLREAYPSVSKVVADGGSYSGACASWIRRVYPTLIDAAVAQSPPLTAKLGFPEYDVSNLVALSSPDSRCAHVAVRVNSALENLLTSDRSALMGLFNASHLLSTRMGDVDFTYGLADSVASAVQYGQKQMICQVLLPLYGKGDLNDWDYAKVLAEFTAKAWGADYFRQCWYDSECMRNSVTGYVAQSARSWYWVTCTQLGYLQSAPVSGLRIRSGRLTVENLLDQCRYIFGEDVDLLSEEKVQAFNSKFGGGSDLGASRIFESDYSDDPWKMASSVSLVSRTSWQLGSPDNHFFLLTCDGCAHCGAGVPADKLKGITENFLSVLGSWGITAPAAAGSLEGDGQGLVQRLSMRHLRKRAAAGEESDSVAHLQQSWEPVEL